MTREQKIEYMKSFCEKYGAKLELDSECGFGRECVGITINGSYPDYSSYEEEDWDKNNGDVWEPEDSYHKHPCVAVLGTGEAAESQLYEWLKWFDENGFVVESGSVKGVFHPIEIMLGKNKYCRMVKKRGVLNGDDKND